MAAYGMARRDEWQAQHALGIARRRWSQRGVRGRRIVGFDDAACGLDEGAEPGEQRGGEGAVVGGGHGAGGQFDSGGQSPGIEVFEGRGHRRVVECIPMPERRDARIY